MRRGAKPMSLLSSSEEIAGLSNGGGGDKAPPLRPPSEKRVYCIVIYTILIGEYVDTLRYACYCAPRLTTKGQTHREAGAQSYGPLETEAAGPPKGGNSRDQGHQLTMYMQLKLQRTSDEKGKEMPH